MSNNRVLVPVSHPLGGIRTYMLYNFRCIHNSGYRFTFLSQSGSVFDSFKKDVESWEGTEFINVTKNTGSVGVIRELRRVLSESSFCLIHSQGLKAGTETAIANLFKRVPHIITLHDVIIPQNDIPGHFKNLKKFIISRTTKRATVIIPVSHDCEQNHIQNFPAWKNGTVRIETIVNGIDVERLDNSRNIFESADETETTKETELQVDQILQHRLRNRFDIGEGVIVGGFFGRFMPQKGFDILLNALSILACKGYRDRFRLIATRDTHGYLSETINETMRDANVSAMVKFVDLVPDIVPLLLQVDLMVMPSRWEACPLLPMESLVLGVPVVGSDCIGLREVLQNTPSIVVKNDNAESLADGIIKFIETQKNNNAKNYIPEAKKRFNVIDAANKLLEIYNSMNNPNTKSTTNRTKKPKLQM
ncbi:MAG: glycosyltransferase family 4 protein [Planctomycetaceae bacterium]|jgi:glycosyltransferase involved in cell wall biosynthesis|nr:glycosyltransferase family 4 protein [Planctomycetaceae bacterium]